MSLREKILDVCLKVDNDLWEAEQAIERIKHCLTELNEFADEVDDIEFEVEEFRKEAK